jgi:hypothetical protein
MTKHHVYFSPYFTSNEFQNSKEREFEVVIEDKFKAVMHLITKIWRNPNKPVMEEIVNSADSKDKELIDRIQDENE